LDYINNRLQNIYSLQKKHQVADVSSLLEIERELSEKVFLANDIDNQLIQLEKDIKLSELELNKLAKIISDNRVKVAPELTNNLLKILSDLGMPNAQLSLKSSIRNIFSKMEKMKLNYSLAPIKVQILDN
jgi:DNA repair protein RecN (Recombination protein N)